MTEPALAARFALGQLAFDRVTGEIVGPGGREQLDPKVAAVFAALLDHGGDVVSRETLLDEVWQHRVVTDDVLSRCIYQLRRQLAAAGGERYRECVETLPKRGYRLHGQPAVEAAADETSPIDTRRGQERAQPDATIARLRWASVAVGAIAAVALMATIAARRQVDRESLGKGAEAPAIAARVADASPALSQSSAKIPAAIGANTIAVLPFADLSEGRDQAFLAHGISEELLGILARRTHLAVTARTSSFAFSQEMLDAVQIGRRLQVAHLIEGSVRREGDRLRISATLVDTRDARRVWSQTYEREFRDLIDLQNDVAESIASELDTRLTGAGVSEAVVDPAAHSAFLHGRFLFNRRGPGDIEAAERQLRTAVERDPEHARAWAALAAVYRLSGDRAESEREREAVLQALALGPDLPEAHLRAAVFFNAANERDRMRRHFQRAADLDPANPLLLSMQAGKAFYDGKPEEAVEFQRRVVAQDPISMVARGNYANYLAGAGRFDEARLEFRTALELNPAAYDDIAADLVMVSVLEGRRDQAWQEALKLPPSVVRDTVVAMLAAANGRGDEGEAAMARLSAASNDDPLAAARAAEALAVRGDVTGALAMIDKVGKPEPHWTPACDTFFEAHLIALTSRLLAPVRSDARWPAASKRLCIGERIQ